MCSVTPRNKGLRIDLVFGNRAVFDPGLDICLDRLQPLRRTSVAWTGNPDHAPVIVDLA